MKRLVILRYQIMYWSYAVLGHALLSCNHVTSSLVPYLNPQCMKRYPISLWQRDHELMPCKATPVSHGCGTFWRRPNCFSTRSRESHWPISEWINRTTTYHRLLSSPNIGLQCRILAVYDCHMNWSVCILYNSSLWKTNTCTGFSKGVRGPSYMRHNIEV